MYLFTISPYNSTLVPKLKKLDHKLEILDEEDALHSLKDLQPDILLVWEQHLESLSTVNFITRVRKQKVTIPLIVLNESLPTSSKAEASITAAFIDSGADLHLFAPTAEVLQSYIASLLRRQAGYATQHLEIGNLRLSQSTHKVHINGGPPLHLPPRYFNILEMLMLKPNKVFSRETFLSRTPVAIDDRTVDSHVHRLRKLLLDGGADINIKTVYGFGYMLETE